MITVVKGDLLKSDCDVIIHQANCFAKMGAGIAKQIVAKYPMVGLVDKSFKIPVGSRERLGNYSEYKDSNGVTIVNMYSQYNYGRGKLQTDYKAMEKAFMRIMQEVKGNKIGLPYLMGCDLAGGNWDTVYSLLEHVSNEVGRDIYLYKFKK